MRELTFEEVGTIGGGLAKELTYMGVSAVQVGTGLVTGNPLRVATGSFTFGYNLGTAMGLGTVGSALGGGWYDLLHSFNKK